jgi:predicted porin
MKSTIISALLITTCLYSTSSQGIELYKNDKTMLNFDGNFSVYYLKNDTYEEVNDGFSRYIFDLSHNIKYDWKALAKLEWGIQISNTEDKIIVNRNRLTSTGPATDAIWLRQGFVGVQHEQYGQFTLGKQWGVSYDVAGVTDWFEIFGAEAQGTYNFGTDGGFSGSGRAEQALQYKLNYQNLKFGIQYLASGEQLDLHGEDGRDFSAILNFDDAYGLSVIYQSPFDLGFGLAYNQSKLSLGALGQISEQINDELITAHITYREYGNLGLHLAVVYADMKNHDINDVGKVMNKATGIELYSSYRFENDISLILGYNSLKDRSKINIGSNGVFHKEYFILSAKYHWDDDFYIYLESKVDRSTLSDNTSDLAEDATGIGMMFEF